MGEHLLCKQGVIGSIPFTSTRPPGCGARRARSVIGEPRRRAAQAVRGGPELASDGLVLLAVL